MKNIKYLIFGLSILFFSCSEEFLEQEPTDSITADLLLSNMDGIQLSLNGTYRSLGTRYFDACNYQLYAELRGGDVRLATRNHFGQLQEMYQFNVTPSNRYSNYAWEYGYQVIDNANNILFALEEVEGEVAVENRVRGEALALRGYSLLLLANLYSDKPYSVNPNANSVVLRLEPYDAADDPSLPRSTVQEVYTQIIADLEAAEALLDDSGPTGRFNKRSVQGALARAYLDMENWAEARDWAIAAHRDQALRAEDITDGFYDFNQETMLGYHFTTTDKEYYRTHPSYWYLNTPAGDQELWGYSIIWYTPEFYALFDPADIRRQFIQDADWADYFNTSDCWISYKFQHRDNVLAVFDLIRMRVGEMYLIEAEARAELGEDALAQQALFVVQERAGYGATQSTSTGSTLLSEIYLERRKELYGEGHCSFDYMRRNEPIDRTNPYIWSNNEVIPANDDRMSVPIPQKEIDANDAISEDDQNGGY